jgi:hypothetical protein
VTTNRIRNKLFRHTLPHLSVIVLYLAGVIFLCPAQSVLNSRTGSLPKDELQAVYHPDPQDAWNRIFYCLFTRTIKTRLSEDFSEGAPFTSAQLMGLPGVRVSANLFERIEGGDGAQDPLYPSFLSYAGVAQALAEPRYSMLKRALADALGESRIRPALNRALMQNDIWAAFDILYQRSRFRGAEAELLAGHRSELLPLLARFIRKLALTSQEIKELPSNYAAASRTKRLPDLFGTRSEWMEVRWLPNRLHDDSVHFRRAARVFLKPASHPANRQTFLNALRDETLDKAGRLDAVALVIECLLIDRSGAVVPSPITFEVQQRSFNKGGLTELRQFELSRKLFINDPGSGGMVTLDDNSGVYLSSAGNDYTFASTFAIQPSAGGSNAPVFAALRTRCIACHGPDVRTVFTFSFHPREPQPAVEQLNPAADDHGNYVANRKMDRDDFKALIRWWADQRN